MLAKTSLNAKSYILPEVKWFHGDEQLEIGGRLHVLQKSNGDVELTFSPAVASDHGTYTAKAMYPTGIAQSSAFLTVKRQYTRIFCRLLTQRSDFHHAERQD